MRIILASKSPRRKQILEENGYKVIVDASDLDERKIMKADIKELVKEIARQKALIVAKRHKDSIVLACDTMVYFNGKEIGQQDDDKEACKTMRALSGKTHEVLTGIYIIDTKNNHMLQGIESSKVTLKKISESELEEYVCSGQYKGKAGAYNIADPDFKSFVKEVKGSYTNIMGLPIEKIKKMLSGIEKYERMRA